MANKHKKHRWLRLLGRLNLTLSFRTKIIVAIATAAIVIGVLVIILLVIVNQKKPAGPNESNNWSAADIAAGKALIDRTKRAGAVQDEASDAIKNGDASKADQAYKQAIDAEDDTAQKIRLIIDHSRVLYANKQYEQAIAVAKSADGLSDDKYLIASWLSKVYEDQKQYQLAIQNYQLAAQWASSKTNTSHLSKQYYQSQAARVEALQKGQQ